MEPIIKDNALSVVSGIPYLLGKPKKGDIVLCNIKNTYFIKRIHRVKNNEYYVAGDNKNDSYDSRAFGYVNRKKIIAKIIYYF